MNFRRRTQDEPEINLIPFIDVLLVVLIFLMLSTTYSQLTQLQIKLPVAQAEALRAQPKEIVVGVSREGVYSVNQIALEGRSVDTLSAALREAAQQAGPDGVVIIQADANTTHQAVIAVMEAARRGGLTKITFATQSAANPSEP